MPREFEGDGISAVVGMRAGHEYVGATHGSGIVSNAADVLEISVLRGMKGVGRVCEMCMYLAQGGVGGEWIRGLGLGFTNPVGTGECWTCVWSVVVLVAIG